mgnify:FL=1
MFHFPAGTTAKAKLPFEPDTAVYADDGTYVPILLLGNDDEYVVFVADTDVIYYGFSFPANEIVHDPYVDLYV